MDDREENTLHLWELYANENGLRQVHMKTAAAANLKNKIGNLLTGRSLSGFQRVSRTEKKSGEQV